MILSNYRFHNYFHKIPTSHLDHIRNNQIGDNGYFRNYNLGNMNQGNRNYNQDSNYFH